MNEKPIILSQQIVAESRLFCIEKIQYRFSNGNERTFERLKGRKKGAVLIVPFLDDQTILLVKEYAAGSECYELGFPKGVIEQEETALEAANREMMEELGYGAQKLDHIASLSVAPGYVSSKTFIILARSLFQKKLPADEPEPLETVPWQLNNLPALLAREDFTEARSVAALFLAQNFLISVRESQ